MNKMSLQALSQLFRKNFLAGVFVAVPLVVIFWIFDWLLGFLEGFYEFIPEGARPKNFLPPALASIVDFLFLIGVAILLIVGLSLLGSFSKLYLGRKLFRALGDLIQKIPVLGTIYSTIDQLMGALNTGGGKQFNRVVFVEYPRKGVWAVGFVTGPFLADSMPPGYLNVFVPTVPNPTAGFHLIVPESEARESNMKVDEAFKLILSLGIAQGQSQAQP